jgi:hypothetical protein
VEIASAEDLTFTVLYLPHQAVKNEKQRNPKWRIDFDTSSHETNAPSLNEILEMGPKRLPEIFATHLLFNLHFAAIISNITPAFLQLSLGMKDRDLTRFSLHRITQDNEVHCRLTAEIMKYRFTRLLIGIT